MNDTAQAAVLFVDVSGSTRLYESAGDAVAHAAIDKCITIFKDKTAEIGSRVIKTMNLAARLAGLASKGQIMTSRETVELMSPIMRSSSRRLYSIEVKGKATAVDLYEILWQQTEDQTTLATNRSMVKQKLTALRLKYLDQEIVLEGARTSLTLGRDKGGDMVIIDRMASRQHGKIERRLDKFVLADHSANGTYVTVEGDTEVVLRRAEFALRGHGWIAFGQPRASATETVEFFCE